MSNTTSLEGRVIAVTGAGRGIGREIALLAARQGAAVVVNDFGGNVAGEGADQGPAQEVVKEITSAGGRAAANTDSVADPKGAERIVQTALDSFGKVDGLVNNAGILRDKIFHHMTEDDFNTVIDVHLRGSYNVARAAAPHFRKQGHGSMVHMTSTSALIGNIAQANYSAAKLGIAGLSRSIAIDMQKFGVRSNAIAPFAWSRLVGTMPEEAMQRNFDIAKMRAVSPAHIAPVVAFLLSDAAADINGQIFGVRKNEIFLMSQPRPMRQIHRSEGWTQEALANVMLPAFKSSLVPMESSGDVFSWDAI